MTAEARLAALEKRVRMLALTTLLAIVLAGIATAFAIRQPSALATGVVTIDERGIRVAETVGIDASGIHVRSGKTRLELADTVALSGPDGRVETGVAGKAYVHLSATAVKDSPVQTIVALDAAAGAATSTFQAGTGAARISVGPTADTAIEIQRGQLDAKLVPQESPPPTERVKVRVPPPQLQRADPLDTRFESPF